MNNNKYRQSKSSIIFSTCWCNRGATIEQISEALTEAGFDMPIDTRLMPMLQGFQRKQILKRGGKKWRVGVPYRKKK